MIKMCTLYEILARIACKFILFFNSNSIIKFKQIFCILAERHLKFQRQKESAWKKYGMVLKIVPVLKCSYSYIVTVPLIVFLSFRRRSDPLFVFLQSYCPLTPGLNAKYIVIYFAYMCVVFSCTVQVVSLFVIMVKCIAVSTFWLKFEPDPIFKKGCECFFFVFWKKLNIFDYFILNNFS